MHGLAALRGTLRDYRAAYRRYARASEIDGTSAASDDARYDTELAAVWLAAVWLAAAVSEFLRHAPRGKKAKQ